MSPVVVKEKGKAEKRKKDEKEKTNNEIETVTPPAKQVSIYTSGKKMCTCIIFDNVPIYTGKPAKICDLLRTKN